jgi:hypothetical protein
VAGPVPDKPAANAPAASAVVGSMLGPSAGAGQGLMTMASIPSTPGELEAA